MLRQWVLQRGVRLPSAAGVSSPLHRGDHRSDPLCRMQHGRKSSTSHARSPPSRKVPVFAALVIMTSSVAALMYSTTKAQRTTSFVDFELVAKQPVSSTASIFHLSPKHDPDVVERYSKALGKGIWNVRFKQPQLQIVRAYTPLPPLTNQDIPRAETKLQFLIRQDENGEVSNYLHRLPLGSNISVSGPKLEYAVPKDVQSVVFIAGGTGIAPALQVAHAMFERDLGSETATTFPKLHVLWASRRREDCAGGISDHAPAAASWWSRPSLLGWLSAPQNRSLAHATLADSGKQGLVVKELEALKKKYPGRVQVDYFVDEESSFIHEPQITAALSSMNLTKVRNRCQVLVSGPPGFIAYVAGPKVWRDGFEEQGPLGGLLGSVLWHAQFNVKVWKI